MSDSINFPVESTQDDLRIGLSRILDTYSVGPIDSGKVSDGHHTFDELYQHRAVLFAVVTALSAQRTWRSKAHEDGSMFDGMFIVGMNTAGGPISYHIEAAYWEMFDHCETMDAAPHYDGYSPADVVDRLAAHVGMIQNIIESVRASRRSTPTNAGGPRVVNHESFGV
jgi:hypothetical protein